MPSYFGHIHHTRVFLALKDTVCMHACVHVCGDLCTPTHVCVNVPCVSVCSGVCMHVHACAHECVCVFWQWFGEQDEEVGGEFVCSGPLV